jgi:HK97 family phage major capsid protein
MKKILTCRPLVVLALLAVVAVMSMAFGHQFHPADMLAGMGMVPLAIGETGIDGLTDLLKKQGEAFEQFKQANDNRLKEIESKGYAPAGTVAKVETINAELTKLSKEIADVAKKANRPAAGADGTEETPEQAEHKQSFRAFLRKGSSGNLSDLERKAMGRGSDVDGGYLVIPEMASEIDRIAQTVSAMRSLADVRTIGSNSLQFRVKTRGVGASWIGESEAGGESQEPQYARLEISAEEIEAEPWVYNDTLEDADIDLEADLADEAGIAFGEAEGLAFITGTGVKKPRGILGYTNVANASYAWGKVGYIASGASGAFAASNPADKIIDLLHALKTQYRNGATLLMADTTLAEVRKLKDGSGNYYLFNPDPTGDFAGLVLGKPVAIDDNMPAIGANTYSIAYANFKRAYRIVDRRGMALIRDNITTKGTTKFNFRKRVGGGIRNFEAIKLMKFGTS